MRPPDLGETAARFLATLRSGGKPKVRDWNKISWCLWTTTPAIANEADAFEAILARVAGSLRARPFRQLAAVYLAEFATGRPGLDRIAALLRLRAEVIGEPWRQAQVRCGLFDGTTAPRKFARVALHEKANVEEMFQLVGLDQLAINSMFAEAAYVEGLIFLREAQVKSTTEHVKLVKTWCLRRDGRLASAKFKPELGRALVYPLREMALSKTERRAIVGFLLGHFGDPRTRPAEWIGMDDVAAIIRRWLVEQSIHQFLDVVDRVARPEQWSYRRAFWTAVYDVGLIDDAYVAFDPIGAREAERTFKDDAPFGRLRSGDGQIQEGHSVLIMKIGSAVVADWSHNGRCNIWERPDEKGAPSLHRTSYSRNDLRKDLPRSLDEVERNNSGVYTHSGAAGYLWQNKVAGHLYRLTGVRVAASAYRTR